MKTLLMLIAWSLSLWSMETVEFQSLDGLTITADHYAADKPNGAWVLLCHQAGSSRGEYRETAVWLAENGFSCLALDQRSGKAAKSVENETYKRALALKKPTEFQDAKQDIEAALAYMAQRWKPKRLILLGSSYSAMLAIRIAGEGKQLLAGAACFSPGEYLEQSPSFLSEVAGKITIPIFITSAAGEKGDWSEFAAKIPPKLLSTYLPASEGVHGAKALWPSSDGSQGYRRALAAYLAGFR